jgi:Rap1a immunity proteins
MRRTEIRRPFLVAALVAAAAVLVAGPAWAAPQEPNTAEWLLRQCEAYVAEDAENPSRMTCENTIWSTLRAMDFSKKVDPAFKPPYCKPEGTEISIREGADLYVKYVNRHPEVLHEPAEHAVILAIRSAYPCAL